MLAVKIINWVFEKRKKKKMIVLCHADPSCQDTVQSPWIWMDNPKGLPVPEFRGQWGWVYSSILVAEKTSHMLSFLLICLLFTANIAVFQICSQVLYLCFPSPSATSEPSGLDALTLSCNVNDNSNLIDLAWIAHVHFYSRSFSMLFLIFLALHSSLPMHC